MCRLFHPVSGSSKAAFALRSHPSLAHDLVAGLEDLPSEATRPRRQSNSLHLGHEAGWFPHKAMKLETIPLPPIICGIAQDFVKEAKHASNASR